MIKFISLCWKKICSFFNALWTVLSLGFIIYIVGAILYQNQAAQYFIGIALGIFFLLWLIGSGYLQKGYYKVPHSIRKFWAGCIKFTWIIVKIIFWILLGVASLWLIYTVLMISPIFSIIVILIIIALILYFK